MLEPLRRYCRLCVSLTIDIAAGTGNTAEACDLHFTDGGCLACRYDLTDELRTQTDTRQLKLWSQEDIVLDP